MAKCSDMMECLPGANNEGGTGEEEEWKGEWRKETDKMICSCLAVSYDTCTRFAYTYARAAKVFTQTLVVLEQATEL